MARRSQDRNPTLVSDQGRRVTIYVCEEYGYRLWRWDTDFTSEEELMTWWKKLPTVQHAFFSADALGHGKWTAINQLDWPFTTPYKPDAGHMMLHVHTDGDSYLVDKHSVAHEHAGYNPDYFRP